MKAKIQNLISLMNNGEVTAYQVHKETGITQSKLASLKNGDIKIDNLTLQVAEKLVKYYNKEMKKMKYELKEMENGELKRVEYFDDFKDVKEHLIQTDYFSWINENEPNKELPKFEDTESIQDIQNIFDEYDYSWWTMVVEEK